MCTVTATLDLPSRKPIPVDIPNLSERGFFTSTMEPISSYVRRKISSVHKPVHKL